MDVEAGRNEVYLGTYDFVEKQVERDETLHLSLPWLRDRLAEQAVAHNQQQPGFKGQLLLVEQSTGKFITITLWEEEPVSLDIDLQTMHTMAESVALSSFQPEIYEVKAIV